MKVCKYFCLIIILFLSSCKYPLFVTHTVKRDGFFNPVCLRLQCRKHYKKIKKEEFRTAYLYLDNPLNYAKNKVQAKETFSESSTPEPDEVVVIQNIILENVYFKSNTAILETASFLSLDVLVNKLKMDSDLWIEIIGHTDNIGKKDYNNQLSQKRANSIGDYLILKGIAKERVKCIGVGSKFLIDKTNTEAGNAKNRRVEIKLSNVKK